MSQILFRNFNYFSSYCWLFYQVDFICHSILQVVTWNLVLEWLQIQ